MKRPSTPVLDAIAAESRRFQLRTWVELLVKYENFEMFCRVLEHVRGYLDALEDEGYITCSEWSAAGAELSNWLQQWLLEQTV